MKSAANSCANPSAHQWLNAFVEKEESKFGRRYNQADIGILFSGNNYFAMALPGSIIPDKNYQPHRQDYLGFATALIDAHLPFRVVTDWKLTTANMAQYKTFIMPCADYLNDSVLSIVQKWVENGGRLVLTGSPGKFFDTDGLFQRRTQPLLQNLVGRNISNAPEIVKNDALVYDKTVYTRTVGNGTVVWTAEPVGMNYFNAKYSADAVPRRAALLSNLKTMMGTSGFFDGSALPVTVGSYVWNVADGNSVFVDLVNYNYNETTDQTENEQNLTLKIKLVAGKTVSSVLAVAPEGNSTLNFSVSNGWATISIPTLQNYLSVKLLYSSFTTISDVAIKTKTVSILPNPAKNEIKIVSENQIQSVDIYDLTGRRVLKNIIPVNNQLNISVLTPGIYSVYSRFSTNSILISKIIVIQ